ncbi:MAG: hypothetical protein ACXWFH_06920 [Solirubrobacterales bacterium]
MGQVKLGRHIRMLWRRRPWVAASLVLALLMGVWSAVQISLIPPRLTPRSQQMATATTHVVVDTPRSSILDLRQDTYILEALRQRAIVLGNVPAEGPVRSAIAERAQVPVDSLQVTPPLTPTQPRVVEGSPNQKHATDIIESTDQHRISIQTNPTVPIMDIYSQAPTAQKAEIMANAVVDELRGYLADVAAAQGTPEANQIHLVQLGRANGEVINDGVEWQVGLLAFVLTFSFACATVILFSRVREGWRTAELSERAARG